MFAKTCLGVFWDKFVILYRCVHVCNYRTIVHLIDASNTLTPVHEKWGMRDHLVIMGCGNQKNISYLEVYEDLVYMYVLTEHIVIIIGVCLSGAMIIF